MREEHRILLAPHTVKAEVEKLQLPKTVSSKLPPFSETLPLLKTVLSGEMLPLLPPILQA